MKPSKIFECFCADGFTGDFCEFKFEQDHLLYVSGDVQFMIRADGKLIEEKVVDDPQVYVFQSCSTMLNGEAVIIGGLYPDIFRQVLLK